MEMEHGLAANSRASTGFFFSPSNHSARPEDTSPVIKRELLEKELPLTRIDEAEEGFDEETEGIVADQEGVEYYYDASFKIKQVSAPTIVMRTLNDLYHTSKTKYLKLDPEYQRDVVWDETRASGLIASILQGYFIPPIIFNIISQYEDVDGSGKKVLRHYRICVDGKQRLTSVQKFIEGQIGVLDSSTPQKKWFYTHPIVDGVEKISNHNILPETTKGFFRMRKFCCYEYFDLPVSVEENMFQLVQRGMPLTPAERMRALSTAWAVFAKQYEEDYAMVINLSKQGRASGFRMVMTIFSQILEVMHPSGNKKKNREGVGSSPTLQASPQVLTRLLLDDQSLTEAVKVKFKEVFDKYQELVDLSSQSSSGSKLGCKIIPNSAFDPAPDYLKERGVGHTKTFSPLELVATAILLLVHGDSRTIGMLVGDIKEMRIYLRRAHKDLRLNPPCWASAWLFIETDLISLRGGRGAMPSHGVAASTDGYNFGDNMSRQEPVTARQRAMVAKSTTKPSSPARLTRTSSSRAGINNVVTAEPRDTTAKDKDTWHSNGLDDSSIRNQQPARVSPLHASDVVFEADVSASNSFRTTILREAGGMQRPKTFQLSSPSDESDDDSAIVASKKRKHS